MASEKSRFAWTKQVLPFNDPELGRIVEIPAYTKCQFVKPSDADAKYAESYQHRYGLTERLLLVKLSGRRRFVLRSDLLTEREFDARREQLRASGVLPED